MNGFLGTSASLWTDYSLIVTLVIGILASLGAMQAHRKRYSSHCPVMAAVGLGNWLPVLFVMIPSYWQILQGNAVSSAEVSTFGPLFHGILGLITQILITYTVFRMVWIKTIPPKKPLWLMRITMTLWMLTVIGGIGVYIILYVIR